ncbi:DUF2637 domain-containing protein [Streptomyces sp. DSM 41987]|uniref:DUF2637 domain-containing protein n=1 Tax=Streptomyces TaxID=1883 RepID=UPI0018E0493D|nr:DUF2637 domain-containing protein [Streptomyces fildesensis]
MKRLPKTLLVLALVGVVGMAFRVSWNAQRDVAATVGADGTASLLYPFVVDGLMALALVATLVLTGQDRTTARWVLAGYTAASLVLNYVHGLVPALHDGGSRMVLAEWAPANWALVLLATSLPVGSIFFGSDLVAKVLHHRTANQDELSVMLMNQSVSDLQESTPPAMPEVPVRAALESADPHPVVASTAQPVAAVVQAPRRATGRVPQSARNPRPTRTPDQLLIEGREATAAWPDDALTAEAIRKELRTAPAKARLVRDALKAERAPDGPADEAVS